MDLIEEYHENIEKYRDYGKSLISKKIIDNYFEISTKSNKGIDILWSNLVNFVVLE